MLRFWGVGREMEQTLDFKMKKKSAPKVVTSRQENSLINNDLRPVEKLYLLSAKSQNFFSNLRYGFIARVTYFDPLLLCMMGISKVMYSSLLVKKYIEYIHKIFIHVWYNLPEYLSHVAGILENVKCRLIHRYCWYVEYVGSLHNSALQTRKTDPSKQFFQLTKQVEVRWTSGRIGWLGKPFTIVFFEFMAWTSSLL